MTNTKDLTKFDREFLEKLTFKVGSHYFNYLTPYPSKAFEFYKMTLPHGNYWLVAKSKVNGKIIAIRFISDAEDNSFYSFDRTSVLIPFNLDFWLESNSNRHFESFYADLKNGYLEKFPR